MRIHVTTKLIDQPWQHSTTSTFIPPPLPSTSSTLPPLVENEAELKVDEAGDMSVDQTKGVEAEPDFKEGTGIPRFEVSVSAEILEVSYPSQLSWKRINLLILVLWLNLREFRMREK